MIDYKAYLQKQGYTETTIKSYVEQVQLFIKWCNRNHTTAIEIDYKGCLKYIRYLQRKNTTKKTVNHRLGRVKVYLNYLVEENFKSENPIESTTIKGIKKHINYNLLESDELEDLYYSFETTHKQEEYHIYTAKRDKIIVGFMVYQGLDTQDLKKLRTEDLQLNKGKIYVPSRAKSNARELELKPWQMMELMEYINEIRPKLMQRTADTDFLFPYDGKRFTITNTIIKKLKKINHKAENINQIRASVITNWLGQYNLRKVQYLAGHRYISSTERYLQDDLENLHEIVNNFHPIS